MSNLYIPYHANISAVLAPDYPPIEGTAAATIDRILRDVPEDTYSYNPGEGKTISGTVRVAGDVVAGARVILMSEIEDTPIAYGYSDAAGAFEFNDLSEHRKFFVIVKLPSGWQNWEYMVSSRRNPV